MNKLLKSENGRFLLTLDEFKQFQKRELHDFTFVPSNTNPLLYVSPPLDILLDTEGLYKDGNHPLWVYFKNGYCQNSSWLPLVIDNLGGYIPLKCYRLKIQPIHFHQLREFIDNNYFLIKQLADEEIDYMDFSIFVRGLAKIGKIRINDNVLIPRPLSRIYPDEER